jgi:hypothetical protein
MTLSGIEYAIFRLIQLRHRVLPSFSLHRAHVPCFTPFLKPLHLQVPIAKPFCHVATLYVQSSLSVGLVSNSSTKLGICSLSLFFELRYETRHLLSLSFSNYVTKLGICSLSLFRITLRN